MSSAYCLLPDSYCLGNGGVLIGMKGRERGIRIQGLLTLLAFSHGAVFPGTLFVAATSLDHPNEEAQEAQEAQVAPRPVAPPPSSEPVWETITFEAKSWGAPVSRWEYNANSGGVWIDVDDIEGLPIGNYTLAYHLLEADQARYLELEALVRQLPFPAPDFRACKNRINDLPYGTIRLTRGAMTTEIAWNSGCQDPDYVRFVDLLRQADQLVTAWGEASPVARTETVGQD